MKKTILLLSVFTLLAFFSQNQLFAQKTLPDISLNDLDGKSINLKDYTTDGKITVFSFWATWCSPCKKELSNLSDLYEDWQEDYDVEIVAVNIDDQRSYGKIKPYVNGQGWEYTVLMDPNEDLKRALNFQTVPYTFVLNRAGEVAYEHTGYVEGDEYELEDEIRLMAEEEEE